ncbi:hypothetical protein EZV62_015651 [Acer yangbiense]|uniref:Uncharacterized protein n=1 Tax=Acer yangbiense TaxID=1000413 RepID=A0A5C7HNE1_9ROSI|nr:hypothetical protein EZV62_015651 [Acer yangbiense]
MVQSSDRRAQGSSKRKVNFDLPDDEREPKKGKPIEASVSYFNSYEVAEPLKENDLGSVVTEMWEENGPSNSIGDLKAKLERCAVTLSGWSRNRFGNIRKQINEKNKEIENLYKRCREDVVIQKIKTLERSVESLLETDELYWKQRSRADWFSVGDWNTKFFHERASARKKKNCISSLIDMRRGIQDSDEGMANAMDIILLFSSKFSVDDLALFCITIWAIWDLRNAFVNLGKRVSTEQVVAKFENLLAEFRLSTSALIPAMEKMWKTKGGAYVALLMLVMILFIYANPSGATSLVPMKSNSSSGCSSIHDCLIADDQSLEFLLGSEVVTQNLDISKSLNPYKPIAGCGRYKDYYACTPNPHASKIPEHCTYRDQNRACIR